jgi:ABC-2 type transport system ATP-binding protein
MIQVEHLVKRYGNHFALADISFEINEGEIVGLLGPNGAGKSTTMNILTGYLSATSGEASVGDVSITEDPLEAKRLIGYLPEQPPVYPDMTVDEYLNFVYDLKRCDLNREAHLNEIRDVVKLQDVRRRLIRNLSKGYRQRVGIAQALIGDPKVIIFDEPTVGLDPKQILEVRNLIRSLGGKHTVILSTHILAEVQAVCERIVVINHGKIIANERTDELARVIEENVHYRYAICGPQREVLSAVRSVRGVLYAESANERDGEAYTYLLETAGGIEPRRGVFRLCAERGWPIVGITQTGGDLESVFIKLIDRANNAQSQSKGARAPRKGEDKR